jgi:thioesterase domain-containing protein
MDLSRYPPPQRAFMQRIFAACFDYVASEYPGDVIVYEASTTPLFHLPQLRSRWRGIAPRAQFVSIPGTHLSMLRQPYVDQMATDLSARINAFRTI